MSIYRNPTGLHSVFAEIIWSNLLRARLRFVCDSDICTQFTNLQLQDLALSGYFKSFQLAPYLYKLTRRERNRFNVDAELMAALLSANIEKLQTDVTEETQVR